ncbi:uncharacterized protein [Diadema antillarum]|uniref:uncharacterized protein n=1 Tax=Diadema antillarum TaxID=105358 RepID=UPI003A888904
MDAKDDPPSNKDGMLERSIEEIRSKMKEKRRKKFQADLSSSRSRYKNANLILKTSLRMNNRSLAKSLEVAQTEFRQTQQANLELQRERQLLQSVINRYQEQHSKQRNQISGVRDLLNKVTASLLDTVGILGQALDMCVIPRPSKDSSLGTVFRKSCAMSDDDDSSSSDLEKNSAGRSAPSSNPNIFNQNIVSKKKLQKMSARSKGPVGDQEDLCQDSSSDRPQDEIPDLPDIDIPLMFMSDDYPLSKKGKVTARRDTRNISPEELLPMPISREDPGTNFTADSEIKEVAEETETMLNEAAAENPVRRNSSWK